MKRFGKTVLGFKHQEDETDFLETTSELYRNREFSDVADMICEQVLSGKYQSYHVETQEHFEVLFPHAFPNPDELMQILCKFESNA